MRCYKMSKTVCCRPMHLHAVRVFWNFDTEEALVQQPNYFNESYSNYIFGNICVGSVLFSVNFYFKIKSLKDISEQILKL